MAIQFAADFTWGAATSGPQAEGTFHKKHENIFDYHYHTRPQDFYHNVGPDVASNFYNDYEQDLKLLKQAGVQALRISIQWTRLIDDLEAARWIRQGRIIIDACLTRCMRWGSRRM